MKIRTDFVTNSSSSSFIICFARVADAEKAAPILNGMYMPTFSAEEIKKECDYFGEISAGWCNATIYGAKDAAEQHPDALFVLLRDWNEAEYDEDGDPIYDYDFGFQPNIDAVTEENGFADIEVAVSEGFNG